MEIENSKEEWETDLPSIENIIINDDTMTCMIKNVDLSVINALR